MDTRKYDEENLTRLGGIAHRWLGNSCHLCTESLLRFEGDDTPDEEDSKRLTKLLFHGACSNEKDINEAQEPLCEFCRHLRLNHLLECLKDGELRCSIRFCEFEDIEKRQNCPFCHLLIRSAMPYAFFSGMATRSEFEGGFLEMTVEGGESIYMKFQYPERGWMGARRIFCDSTERLKSPCTGYIELYVHPGALPMHL